MPDYGVYKIYASVVYKIYACVVYKIYAHVVPAVTYYICDIFCICDIYYVRDVYDKGWQRTIEFVIIYVIFRQFDQQLMAHLQKMT